MSDEPADPAPWNQDPGEEQGPVQGQVRHSQLSARVPDDVGPGVFSNGVMILTGPYEVVLDFALRMGEQQRVAARIVLPHPVARQFAVAMQENIRNYEKRFGPVPQMPKPLPEQKPDSTPSIASSGDASAGDSSGVVSHPENKPAPPTPPQIEDIYHDLKLPDSLLSGRYANAVLIRHSASEFCFDFITNVYPRSAVSARVFLAAPHVVPFLRSLSRSLPGSPPEGSASSLGPEND